jgi:hypothetical protein
MGMAVLFAIGFVKYSGPFAKYFYQYFGFGS